MAHAAVDDVIRRGRVPIVCGGSGLYLRAALADMPLPPQAPAGVRTTAERLYDERGPAGAHATLAAVDAPAAAAVHPNDRRRVVRALELAESGHSLAASESRLWSADTRHPTLVAGLAIRPEETAGRIAARTAAMFAAGVVDEVRAARAAHTFSTTAERIHGLQDVVGAARRRDRPRRGDPAARDTHAPVREAAAHVDAPPARRPHRRCGPRSAGRRWGHRGVGVTRPTEHDAVREARDALVIVAAVAPVAAAAAGLLAVAAGDLEAWLRWLVGPLVVAGLLLGTLGSALLLADRVGRRLLKARPYTVGRFRLLAVALGVAILLVAGLPTTWPIVIGFALVCALLGAVILLGAALDM